MADTIVEPQKPQNHNQPQVKMTNSEPAKQATLEPITNQGATSHHKKRKRKHHKKAKIVRDPEEIKELRLQRLNVKREVHWDNRFVLQTIPDLFVQKTKKRQIISRARYPLHSAYVEKERPKLPELKQRMLETATRNNHKSFKIRPTKNSEGAARPKEHAIEKLKEEAGQKEEQKESKKISKKERNKEKLLLKLQQKVKLVSTNPVYRELLADVIERSTQKKHKPIRTIIEKEIDSIGANDNIYSRLEKLAMDRRKMLADIKESGATTILKTYLDFQIHSLLLVEEILKFKAFWQALYVENLKHQRKVHFFLEDKNYLLEMKKEVEEIAANDPFLVEKTNSLQKLINTESKEEELQERKEMMLKIRACELLLIEEQLLADL